MPLNFGVHVPRCQHVRTTGIRCGSPALRGKPHCYYHNAFGQTTRVVREFEDAESIQLALRQVVNWIAQGMDTKRAALTLYALQIASANLKRMTRIIHASDVVRELPTETDAREARAAARINRDSRRAAPPRTQSRKSKPAVATEKPPSPEKIPVNPVIDQQLEAGSQQPGTPSSQSAQVIGRQPAARSEQPSGSEVFAMAAQPRPGSEPTKKPNGHLREIRNDDAAGG